VLGGRKNTDKKKIKKNKNEKSQKIISNSGSNIQSLHEFALACPQPVGRVLQLDSTTPPTVNRRYPILLLCERVCRHF
jgi:hypothetical protein